MLMHLHSAPHYRLINIHHRHHHPAGYEIKGSY